MQILIGEQEGRAEMDVSHNGGQSVKYWGPDLRYEMRINDGRSLIEEHLSRCVVLAEKTKGKQSLETGPISAYTNLVC